MVGALGSEKHGYGLMLEVDWHAKRVGSATKSWEDLFLHDGFVIDSFRGIVGQDMVLFTRKAEIRSVFALNLNAIWIECQQFLDL